MPSCTVNGNVYHFTAPLSIADLLSEMHLSERNVAVERNGMIVTRSAHANAPVKNGDTIEIVTAVGGG